jgi:hypothetical protein
MQCDAQHSNTSGIDYGHLILHMLLPALVHHMVVNEFNRTINLKSQHH